MAVAVVTTTGTNGGSLSVAAAAAPTSTRSGGDHKEEVSSTCDKKRQTTTTTASSSSSSSSWQNAMAGATAGAVSKTVVAPVERVKLLMQLRGSVVETTTTTTSSSKGMYRNGWTVAQTVYREEGLLAFWRGNTPNVLRQAGGASLNFLLMGWYKSTISSLLSSSSSVSASHGTSLQDGDRRYRLLSSFLSGGLAGATATTLLYPMEFLRTRFAMHRGTTTTTLGGMWSFSREIVRQEGWVGLYHGYGVALGGGMIYRALHLGGYDAVKTEWCMVLRKKGGRQQQPEPKLTLWERFVAAQGVSLVAGTLCYPLDSVRRRLMMQAGELEERKRYRGAWDCVTRVAREEGGWRGFYRGIGPNLVRSVGAALVLVVYDVAVQVLGAA